MAPRPAHKDVGGTPGKFAGTELIPNMHGAAPKLPNHERAPGKTARTDTLTRIRMRDLEPASLDRDPRALHTGVSSIKARVARGSQDRASVDEVGVTFLMPQGLLLSSNLARDVKTDDAARTTQGQISVTSTRLTISFTPGLWVDARWPIQNALLHGATYDFSSGDVSMNLDDKGSGLVDMREPMAARAVKKIRWSVRNTPIALPGYDPFGRPRPTSLTS
jgi:hypothetical protein